MGSVQASYTRLKTTELNKTDCFCLGKCAKLQLKFEKTILTLCFLKYKIKTDKKSKQNQLHQSSFALIATGYEFGIILQLAAISHTQFSVIITCLDFIKIICQCRSTTNTVQHLPLHNFEYQERKQIELAPFRPGVTLCFFLNCCSWNRQLEK